MTMDVLIGLHNAVLRQDTDGKPDGGWMPHQRVTLEQAIAAYTLNGAYSSFEEDVKGSVTEGKLADLVVVRPNLFTIPPQEIHKAKVARAAMLREGPPEDARDRRNDERGEKPSRR